MIFNHFVNVNQTVALGTPFCHYLLPLVPLELEFPSGRIKIVHLFHFMVATVSGFTTHIIN